jgi:hypothetical protein
MKSLIALIVSAFLMVASFAQSTPTSVKYNKGTKPALTLLVPYSEDIAEGTIIQKLKEIGYNPETKGALFWKKNTVDGYYVFKNVALRNLNGQLVDLYFKVNRKSRKEEDQSYISMLVSRGEDRFVSSESDPLVFESASSFLNGFTSHSASYKLNVDIQSQQSSVKLAEAKYARLQQQDSTLTKKIKELEETLKNNRLNQETQLKVIEEEKRKLEILKPKN